MPTCCGGCVCKCTCEFECTCMCICARYHSIGTGTSRSQYFVTLQKYHYRESPGNNTDPAHMRACSHTRTHKYTHVCTHVPHTETCTHARTHSWLAGEPSGLAGGPSGLAGRPSDLAGWPLGGRDGRTGGQTAYLHILQDCRFTNLHALECSSF